MKYICVPPGPKSRKIISRDSKVVSPSYGRGYGFVYDKAKGVWLWDADGRRYLDFAAGIATMSVGHSNPDVIKAIKEQLKKGMHAAFPDFYAETPVKFVETLLGMVKGYDKVFLSNSGTESVEAALKLAKWSSRKKWLIAFKGCFHGRTMGSLSMTYSKDVQREGFGPFLPVMHAEYPYPYRSREDPEDLAEKCVQDVLSKIKRVKGDVAAIFVEAIQGEGGYIVPPKNFHKELANVCRENNVLLCDDEVQAGNFRTGKYLAMENFGVRADVVSIAKAIGGGVPLGATLARKGLMTWPVGSHSNTFGGNLLACAAGIATLNYLKKKKLGDNAVKVGKHIMKSLEAVKEENEIVGDVRGMGLMIGIEIVKDKRSKRINPETRSEILCKAAEKGLILLPAGKSTIRISPPLTLTKEQADRGIDILEDAIREVKDK